MSIPHRYRVITCALVLPLTLAACSSKGDTPNHAQPATTPAAAASAAAASASASQSGEPKTYDAAKAAVDKIEAAAKAGDGGTEWDMLTASGQAAMTRADYVEVIQGCPKLIDSSPVLSIALDAGGTSATVKVSAPPAQGGQPYEYRLVYEAGHWKHQPSDGAMNWMVLGADKALTALRNDGIC